MIYPDITFDAAKQITEPVFELGTGALRNTYFGFPTPVQFDCVRQGMLLEIRYGCR